MLKPTARIPVQHSEFPHFLWYLVIVMISCVGCLFYMVLRALW